MVHRTDDLLYAVAVFQLSSTWISLLYCGSVLLGQSTCTYSPFIFSNFANELVSAVSLVFSVVEFPFHRNILFSKRTRRMGHHRLAKFPRLPFFVPSLSLPAPHLTFSDKVVSLFIHIMPPVVLHTVIHLLPTEYSHQRYPALKDIPYLDVWRGFWISTLVHTLWQGWYYLFIMVRRREKIAAGRPTSFTWLRRSYAKTWIGKWVNSLPEPLQPFAFMGVQVSPPSPLSSSPAGTEFIVRVFPDDDDAVSDLVQLKSVFRDILVCGVWLVSMERSDVLCRYIRQKVSEGIGRFTCRSREMAKQSAQKSRSEWDGHTIQGDSEFHARYGTKSAETKGRVSWSRIETGDLEEKGLRCR